MNTVYMDPFALYKRAGMDVGCLWNSATELLLRVYEHLLRSMVFREIEFVRETGSNIRSGASHITRHMFWEEQLDTCQRYQTKRR